MLLIPDSKVQPGQCGGQIISSPARAHTMRSATDSLVGCFRVQLCVNVSVGSNEDDKILTKTWNFISRKIDRLSATVFFQIQNGSEPKFR